MKKTSFSFCLILIILSLITGYAYHHRTKYADIQSNYSINKQAENDTTLKIAVIGDSWAVKAEEFGFCKEVTHQMANSNISCKVTAKGQNGAKSKDIYLNLFNSDSAYGLKQIILQQPKYAIIFCGVNDSHGQYGSSYYSYHTLLIIKHLLLHQIKPILQEIPSYNITKQYEYYSFKKNTLYHALSFLNDFHLDTNNIQRYRTQIKLELKESNLDDSIIYVPSKVLANGYYDPTIYKDYLHLNKEGYKQLANSIVPLIIKDLLH